MLLFIWLFSLFFSPRIHFDIRAFSCSVVLGSSEWMVKKSKHRRNYKILEKPKIPFEENLYVLHPINVAYKPGGLKDTLCQRWDILYRNSIKFIFSFLFSVLLFFGTTCISVCVCVFVLLFPLFNSFYIRLYAYTDGELSSAKRTFLFLIRYVRERHQFINVTAFRRSNGYR